MHEIKLKPLKGYKVFNNVFENGYKLRTSKALAVFCGKPCLGITKYAGDDTVYYGVTISKKAAHKAVTRNRVRRLLREGIRLAFNELDIKEVSFDAFVIVWRHAPTRTNEIHLEIVQGQVKELILKAEKKFSEGEQNA